MSDQQDPGSGTTGESGVGEREARALRDMYLFEYTDVAGEPALILVAARGWREAMEHLIGRGLNGPSYVDVVRAGNPLPPGVPMIRAEGRLGESLPPFRIEESDLFRRPVRTIAGGICLGLVMFAVVSFLVSLALGLLPSR